MTGRNISHYEILEKLGAGGMGEIYKARDPRLNRIVAVKALPASATADPERRRRFLQEAQAASGLNHPNIVTIHDILTDEAGNDYMVMEFIEGKTLGDVIPSGGLGVPKTLQYSAQISDALAAAHSAGIIHRDLKPGNVMVTDRGRVKILDFGLAKITVATSLTEATQTIASGPVTMEGSILGTVSYMSPEQAQGKKVDARSDIFAFGALMYEMVTGTKAFAGDSALTTLTAILRDEVPPAGDLAANVPPELEEVIGRSLRKDPAHRWQSMQEVYSVLSALRARYESGIMDATQILPPKPIKKKSATPMMAGGALGAALVIGGGWYFATHHGVPAPKPAPPQVQTQDIPQAQAQPQPPAPTPVETPAPAAMPAPVDAKAATPTPAPVAAPVRPAPRKDDGTLSNESIIAMQQAKVPEAVMVSQIRAASKTRFDLSTSEVIRLTRAGVPQAVLEAMRGGSPSPSAPVNTPAQPVPSREPAATVPVPVAPAPAPSKTVETRAVALAAGLPIVLSLSANIPNDPEPGTAIKFTVKQDVVAGGAVVIAAGSTVTGEVAGVKKGLPFRGSKPTYRLISVRAVDGTAITLRATPGTGTGDKAERVIEPSARKDKSVLAPAGTEYVGYVDGAHAVAVKK